MKDYHGHEITAIETPDTLITIWEITPSLDHGYDCCVIRGYQNAVKYAKEVVISLMDDSDNELPITITFNQCPDVAGGLRGNLQAGIMTDHPIHFNAEMVRAILAGLKTPGSGRASLN